jgi:hypothetical protein
MNESEKFQNMFPFILENIVREMGDLIGEDLDLQDENINQGNLKEIFSPSNKKFVLTGFNLKHRPSDSAYLLVNLDMAIDLGGRLIMLPEKEILVCKKQGKLEGELLDAFSEITNIITGVINSHCQEYIPAIKLQFIKGKMEIFPPRTDSLPMPQGNHTLLSASLALQDGNSGILQLFFPHTLLENENVEEGLPSEDTAEENMNISTLTSKPRSNQTADSINDSEVSNNSNITTSGGNENEQNKDFDGSFSEDKRPNPKLVEIFLKEGFDPVKEGLEASTDAISTAGRHKEQTRIVSIISQDKSQLEFFQENFIQENVEVMGLSLENDLKQNLTHKNLCCVFLFIKKVNDLGFAQTIQVRTALKKGCPLIVAGPEWTRSKVLKALKYGATDVLITPAERESILMKFQKHLYQPGIDNEHYPDANSQEKDQGIN